MDERGADDRAEDEVVTGGEHETEDERQVGEAEGVRAAAETHVDDADLGAGEPERDRPPGQVRRRVGAVPWVKSAQEPAATMASATT